MAKVLSHIIGFGAGMVIASGVFAASDTSTDLKMMKLAEQSGCVTCHSIAAGGTGPNGLKPIGPPWMKVAEKYKGDDQAVAALTQTVLKGSSPYESHWKGEVSGVAMPPNSVVLSQEQATELVSWIMHLAD